jgi:hypothetical protein
MTQSHGSTVTIIFCDHDRQAAEEHNFWDGLKTIPESFNERDASLPSTPTADSVKTLRRLQALVRFFTPTLDAGFVLSVIAGRKNSLPSAHG